MQPRNTWSFSAPALMVDFVRIVNEAELGLAPRPAVIRVTVRGEVITLVHKSAYVGAMQNLSREAVAKIDNTVRFPVAPSLQCTTVRGRFGLVCDIQESVAVDWTAFVGDLVGLFSDRVECRVEVF